MYIRLSDNFYPMPEPWIRAENPNVSFPTPFVPPAGYAVVLASPLPTFDPATETYSEVQPIKIGNDWMTQYVVRALTPEEIAQNAIVASYVPQSVTMRQARLALLDAGLLSAVQPAIDAMASPAKEAAQIEWEYSSAVQRHNSFVSTLGAALGLSEAQLDNLFVAASQK